MSQYIGDDRFLVTLSPETTKRLKRICEKHGLKKATAIRNLTEVGLDVYEDLEKVGVVKGVLLVESVKKWAKGLVIRRQKTLFE